MEIELPIFISNYKKKKFKPRITVSRQQIKHSPISPSFAESTGLSREGKVGQYSTTAMALEHSSHPKS
jgi:hypothetical protein